MKSLLTVALLVASMASSAEARDWPAHGFYHVQADTTEKGVPVCRVRLQLAVYHVVFALVFEEAGNGTLRTIFMTGHPESLQTDTISIGVDDTRLITIVPDNRSNDDNLPTFVHLSRDAQGNRDFFADLARAAEGGTFLWVGTSTFTEQVPAEGLKDALADQAQCRASLGL